MSEYKKQLTAIPIGVFAGLITIYAIPGRFEILIWLILIVGTGWLGNKYYSGKLLGKTFVFAVLTGISVTLTHITFVNDYLLSHPEETEMLSEIRLLNSDRLTLLMIAPIYWLVLGLLSGFAAIGIRRIRQW